MQVDLDYAVDIKQLETKLADAAADIGNQEFFQRHGCLSKITVYNVEHPDLEPLRVSLTRLLVQRPSPPRLIDNSWWTFLACVGFNFPTDIRKLLYQYFVKNQYPLANRTHLYSAPIFNLTSGLKWFHGLTTGTLGTIKMAHVKLGCLKPGCNATMRSIAYSHSKLAYEAWMDVHMLSVHGISLWTYLNRHLHCLHQHRKPHQRFVEGNMFEKDKYVQEAVCIDCGYATVREI